MDVEVTSVSKLRERAVDAPAAIHVISNDDIRRSGATNIPELLRTVPGLHVAQIDANKWAITARGFNSRFANKLLVLIDGRTIYTPLFSGVIWDQRDTLLEDVDRIEIIRGPGATLWGANAVNGVINIITKDSRDTVGRFVTASLGSEEQLLGGRHGIELNENHHFRSYAKARLHNGGARETDRPASDSLESFRGGFRTDWRSGGRDSFDVIGNAFSNQNKESFSQVTLNAPFAVNVTEDYTAIGGNLLGRWSRELGDGSSLSLQGYVDSTRLDSVRAEETRHTVDFDLQHTLRPNDRHTVVWGGGYRLTTDKLQNSFEIQLDPKTKTDHLFSAFAQDTIRLLPDRLDLTLGSKFEHNDYTGFEVQPSARLAWHPTHDTTLWAAVSRAVRTPTRAESDVRINSTVLAPNSPGNPAGVPLLIALLGDEDVRSEELVAYELGYRARPAPSVSVDVTAFYNVYDQLITAERGTAVFVGGAQPHLVQPFTVDNQLSGESYGTELGAVWNVNDRWRLRGSYSLFDIQLHKDPASTGLSAEAAEGLSPHHQATLQSTVEFGGGYAFDATLRYVDRLAALSVDDYLELDLRLGWKPTEALEVALVGRNLLHDSHFEFGEETLSINPTAVQRSVAITLNLKF